MDTSWDTGSWKSQSSSRMHLSSGNSRSPGELAQEGKQRVRFHRAASASRNDRTRESNVSIEGSDEEGSEVGPFGQS